MALLAAYMIDGEGTPLGDWLSSKVFNGMNSVTLLPKEQGVNGFKEYLTRYEVALGAEKKLEEVVC